jgi:aminoglycoside phosphotransferase (APT) family kinase protein
VTATGSGHSDTTDIGISGIRTLPSLGVLAGPPEPVLRCYRDAVVTPLFSGPRSFVWRLDRVSEPPLVVKQSRENRAAEREYQILRVFFRHYEDNPGIQVPRPVQLFPEENALVSEFIPLTTLSELGALHRRLTTRNARAKFAWLLGAAGHWLQDLHGDTLLAVALNGLTYGRPRSRRSLSRLLAHALKAGLPDHIGQGVEAVASHIPMEAQASGRMAVTHGDYGMANIARSGHALAAIDLTNVSFDDPIHEIARTYTRLLAVPALITPRALSSARGRLIDAYGGYPPAAEWLPWRVWALLDLYLDTLWPGGRKRAIWMIPVRRRCVLELEAMIQE